MIYYIYAATEIEFIEKCKKHLKEYDIRYVSFDALETFDVSLASHLMVTGCLDEIKLLFAIAHQNEMSIGIIPLPKQKELIRTFALPSKLEEAIALALNVTEKPLDLLYCNGTIVLQEVVVGDAPPLDSFDSVLYGKTYFDRIKMFWHTIKKVKKLKHMQMKITDAKENEIKFSAVGLVAVEYSNATFAAKLVANQLFANDGKLSVVILSPVSMMQYIGYLFKSLVTHSTPKSLPPSVGYIKSSQMHIETKESLGVLVDSTLQQRTPIKLEVKGKALLLSVGEVFWEKQAIGTSVKDSIQIDHLPSDEESTNYLSQAIPLFSHASQEQYATLFSNLREESKVSQSFIILLILATIIATFGLFINSSSVVIGAMLLAPLMQPIVSLSMGVLRQDEALEFNGAKTIAIGVFTVLATSAFIALLIPVERLTSEMAGRLSPTILDLFVAIASGAAAAYAKSNEKIFASLAGVAIAVALVPPLAVAGIGLGWVDWHMFSTAFLLFITNLVGIVFAAALTFVLLGFSPLRLAQKGMMIWLLIVTLVALPLYSSFSKMKEDIHIQKTLSNLEFNVGIHDVKLTHIELVHRAKLDEIRCEVISSGILNAEEKIRLKEVILKRVNKDAEVIVTFRYLL